MQTINRTTHPAMYADMDEVAEGLWAYPSPEWQNEFIDAWLESEAATGHIVNLGDVSELRSL